MKFTKLRILGFKSFVEPTEFLIEPGLTGVVGPNGCGKSNLVEAIKWVMGESSYKNMRAGGMDEVIFSGSGSRPARNTAEVTLFLDNASRTAPAAFNNDDTIEITRRIERESGSVYRINGKEARARDVQLLFADAATGARSPSMVGQGRIGELISAKPKQRRHILEDAAGISGLHTRRHEAELRLKATEQNLERVEDVIGQLDTQLESLKRQARQAQRYRTLSKDIRGNEATIYYLRHHTAEQALLDAQSRLTDIVGKVADATTLQNQAARDQAVAANALPALRNEAAKAGATLQRLQLEQTALDKDEAQAESRAQELTRRIEQLEQDMAREHQLVHENKTLFEKLNAEEDVLNRANAQSGDTRQQAEQALSAAMQKLNLSEQAFNTTTKEIAELNAKRQSLEGTKAQAARQIVKLEADIARLDGDIEEVEAQFGQDLFVNAHTTTLKEAEENVLAADQAVQSSEERTATAREQASLAQNKVMSIDKELAALKTEADTLDRVLKSGLNERWESLIDAIAAEPGFEAALAAALGDDLNAATETEAPAHWAGADILPDDPALPTGVEALYHHVSASDLVKRRLMQIGIVDRAVAPSLVSQLKAGQRLVSVEGDLWRWDGYVASAEAETQAAIRLEQKNRLADLEGMISSKEKQEEALKEQLAVCVSNLNTCIEQEKAARDTLRLAQSRQGSARDQLAKAEAEASRLTERRTALQDRRERLVRDLSANREHLLKQEALYDALPATTTLNERLQNEQTLLAEDRTAMAEAKAAFETLAREEDIRNSRLSAIQSERKSWQQRTEAADRQLGVLKERQTESIEEKNRLVDLPAQIARKRAALFGTVETAERERTKSQSALDAAEKKVQETDQQARVAMQALSEVREEKIRIEERAESAKLRLQELAREITEKLDCQPHDLRALTTLGDDSTSHPDIGSLEKRLERLKNERERLGGVNLRAEQEMEEISEKRDHLAHEHEDLIEAIKRLRSAIHSLNKEGRERLLLAFDEVNGHFKRLFTHLFGGGTAELTFTESDDPLEAGLDILARPPGKKPQSMTLLSGGEQALTATALIFAVFLTNPAPICVLDEVDAPLDDANVDRFCNLLDDMKATTDTRFLTITHNPITMARMGRLFGVTMAERGVSQLVSVDLETAESFREAV